MVACPLKTTSPAGDTPAGERTVDGERGPHGASSGAAAGHPARRRGGVEPRRRGDVGGGAPAGRVGHPRPTGHRRRRGGLVAPVAAVRPGQRGGGRPGGPPAADGRRRPGPGGQPGRPDRGRAGRAGLDPGAGGAVLRQRRRRDGVRHRLAVDPADGGRPRGAASGQRLAADGRVRRQRVARPGPGRRAVRGRGGRPVRRRRRQLRRLGPAAGHPPGPVPGGRPGRRPPPHPAGGHRRGRALAARPPGAAHHLLVLAIENIVEMAGFAMLVLLAQDVLGLDARGYGLLLACLAVGGVLGGTVAAWLHRRLGDQGSVVGSILLMSGAWALLAATSVAVLAGAGVALYGLAAVWWNVVTVSFRQAVVPERLQGRVNSAYRLVSWGTLSVGAAAGGVVAAQFGLRPLYAGAAVVLLALAGVAWRLLDAGSFAAARAAAGPSPEVGPA